MKKVILALCALFPLMAEAELGTRFVSASPTVDTSAYATGELIGGKLTFSLAVPTETSTGYIISAVIFDKSVQAVDLDLVLFSSDPTGTTFTDQAAFDIADTDLSKVVAVINFGSASRFAFADNGVKYVGSLAIPAKGAPPGTIYGALVSRGTPTFAAAADVTVQLAISGD